MEKIFYPGKPGEAFRDGKLYRFSPVGVEVLRAWPEPLAWRKTADDGGWCCFRPRIKMKPFLSDEKLHERVMNYDLVIGKVETSGDKSQLAAKRRAATRAGWHLTIPEKLRCQVAKVPQRHWQMLSFLARCGAPAAELLASNPALAFMLANNWIFHQPMVQRPLRSVRSLLPKKRPLILSWLGFPVTRQAEKIVARMDCDSIEVTNLLNLRKCFQDSRALQTLSHLPRINTDVLGVISNPQIFSLVTNRFIHELLEAETASVSGTYFNMICDIWNIASITGTFATGNYLDSLTALIRCHDRLLEELIDDLAQGDQVIEELEFPEPPIPGIPGRIEPLYNTTELKVHGQQQKNCLAAWNQDIGKHNTHYAYRILQPEVATVGLRKTTHGWCLHEIRGLRNQPVKQETMLAVESWLSSYPASMSTGGGILGEWSEFRDLDGLM